ncbi:hypothetical protein DdX_21664 [Ditylenchus destructor]|uniref:Uncharacterized protein n=1 Tax=Ditylenchus destructor TaxID=166010 RepID=A0AAD4MGY4_9BILA|nr:hypothetical protein DdX_21664 [Ditylenchus destructor]
MLLETWPKSLGRQHRSAPRRRDGDAGGIGEVPDHILAQPPFGPPRKFWFLRDRRFSLTLTIAVSAPFRLNLISLILLRSALVMLNTATPLASGWVERAAAAADGEAAVPRHPPLCRTTGGQARPEQALLLLQPHAEGRGWWC